MANIDGTSGNDVLTGTADDDVINGLEGDDDLNGVGGNDVITSGSGTNTLFGGAGNDQLYLDGVDDDGAGAENDDTVHVGFYLGAATIIGGNISGGTGTDSLIFHDATIDPTSVTAQFSGFESVSGTINGTAGNDVLNLGGLTDAGLAAWQLAINGGDGNDTITGGAEVDSISGGLGNDTLNGGDGDDLLNGGAGADTLTGGAGDDRYYVDNAAGRRSDGDMVVEAAGGGSDRVFASVSYVLRAAVHIEVLSTTNNAGTSAIHLTGNELVNSIVGNNGNNWLNGGIGADTLNGLGGDDFLFVDNAADVVIEAAGGGWGDRVFASVSYALAGGAHVEILSTTSNTGTGAINLTGNGFANTLIGNAGVNVLNGGGGNDTLSAFGGNDTVRGDAGGDTLDGGDGLDTLSYAGSSLGVFVRLFNNTVFGGDAGGDTIANFENVLGSAQNDDLRGSNGANVLNGAAGGDTVLGLGDDDTIVGGAGSDTLDGGTGVDTLSYAGSSLGVFVRLFKNTAFGGHAGGDTIANFENVLGSSNDDDLRGSNGVNVLDGALGADFLRGFAGADTFRFTTALGADNVDTIDDYSVADDRIEIDNAVFTGLAAGALAAGAFRTGAAAADADDRIIYNSATGALLFDADGNGAGAAVQFATLSAGLAMTAGEFVVI